MTAPAPDDVAYERWRAAASATLGAQTATTDDVGLLYTARDDPRIRTGPSVHHEGNGLRTCVQSGLDRALAEGDGVTALWLMTKDSDDADLITTVASEARSAGLSVQLDGMSATVARDVVTGLRGGDAAECGLGLDPYRPLLAQGTVPDLDTAVAVATACNGTQGVRAFTVDATAVHESGGTDADEIALVLATGVAYVRAMVAAGLTATNALALIDARIAVTADQFASITKLRAVRICWARISGAFGVPDGGRISLHAVTSHAMLTVKDPWTNILRASVASFAAIVGGADLLTVRPFDYVLDAEVPGLTRVGADRLALHTALVLLEESGIGRVDDPAAGSWYVEARSRQVASTAWDAFAQIESAGGVVPAVSSGRVPEWIEAARQRREEDLDHRRRRITSVTDFPDLDEPWRPTRSRPTAAGTIGYRYAQRYEDLRDRSSELERRTGRRPHVTLLCRGAVRKELLSYLQGLFACGGIDVRVAVIGPEGVGDPDSCVVVLAREAGGWDVADIARLRAASTLIVDLDSPGVGALHLGEPVDAAAGDAVDVIVTLGLVLDRLEAS